MKRTLVWTGLVAIAAVGGALAYRSAVRDRSYRVLIASGEAALSSGNGQAAVEDFSGAVAVRPDAMLARLLRGETYRRRGDLDLAARDFRAASTLDPTATRPLEALGDVLISQERFKRAAQSYEARLRLDDRSAPVRYKLALARYRDGAVVEALADARRATALDGQLAESYYLTALCLRDLGQTSEAVAALEAALGRAPGLLPAREELADLLALSGRNTEQMEQLQVLAGLDSKRSARQVVIALAQARAGQTALSVATLSAALEQAPDQSFVNAALGRVWLRIAQDRPEPDAVNKALEALERAASALSATSETKALYGQALALSGQFEAAEQLFQQAIERYPIDPSVLLHLDAVAEHLGHVEIARAALTDYVALVQPDPEAALHAARVGRLSLKLHDAAGALPWLRRALTATPDDVSLLALMAEAQMQTGDLDGAKVTIRRGLGLEPTHKQFIALERRLAKAGIEAARAAIR